MYVCNATPREVNNLPCMYVDQKGVSEKSLEFGLSTFYALIMYGMYLTYIIQITVLEMVGYTRRESDERRGSLKQT